MKKFVALVLAVVMAIGMATVSFASDVALDGSWPEEQIKIAVEVYDTTDEQFLAIQDYFNYLEGCFNIKFVYSESIASAEDEFAFIDSAAAAGCQALFGYYCIAEAEAVKECIAQGMYYAAPTTTGYMDEFLDNPMYIGGYKLVGSDGDTEHNGDYLGGYELGKAMAEQGYQHIAYCNGGASFGVQMFIDRQEGFLAGLEAGGYTNFTDADLVQGWPGTDDFAAAQSAVISGDYDAVVSSFNVAMWFQPVMESGKDIALAAIGEANETYNDFMSMGIVRAVVYDCEETVFGVYVPMMINAVMGYEEDGALEIPVQRWTITTAEEMNAVYNYHAEGNWFAPAEAVANCLKAINPDATAATLEETYNVSLEAAIASIQ